MALEFLKGAQQPTAQEAVVFLTDTSTADTYSAGEVVANVSELVAVDGPEDVVGYRNGDASGGSGSDEVAEVSVTDGEVVLNLNSTLAGDDSDDYTVASDGGQFFNVDDAVEAGTLEAGDIENDGDIPGTDEDLVFTWTDGDDLTYVEPLVDGIPLVLQASGF